MLRTIFYEHLFNYYINNLSLVRHSKIISTSNPVRPAHLNAKSPAATVYSPLQRNLKRYKPSALSAKPIVWIPINPQKGTNSLSALRPPMWFMCFKNAKRFSLVSAAEKLFELFVILLELFKACFCQWKSKSIMSSDNKVACTVQPLSKMTLMKHK